MRKSVVPNFRYIYKKNIFSGLVAWQIILQSCERVRYNIVAEIGLIDGTGYQSE